MRWLYLHFPSLLLDHYRASVTAATPMALLYGTSGTLSQCCPRARESGVAAGHAVATAQALCPGLLVLPGNPEREQQLLQQLAQWVYSHAAPLSPVPPRGLVIQASALTRLYGDTEALRQALLTRLRQHTLQVTSGFGCSPLMARLMAESAPDEPDAEDAALTARVSQLPVTAMPWPPAVTERLSRMGLRTLGEVLAIEAGALQRRLGTSLHQDLQRLQGTRADPLPLYTPPAVFDQRLDLPQEVPGTDALLFPLKHLVQRLGDFLRLHQRRTDTLWLSLEHPDQPLTRLRLQSASGQSQPAVFMELIRLRLDRLQLSAPVIGLRLRVTRLLDHQAPQNDLLHDPVADPQRAPLLARLMTRLGPDAIRQPTITQDWRPEQRCRWSPVTQTAPPAAPLPGAAIQPLWLLSEPAPLSAKPVLWLGGPERLQTGWWDAAMVQRDYYRARFEDGRVAWLFRAPGGEWFIQGWFG